MVHVTQQFGRDELRKLHEQTQARGWHEIGLAPFCRLTNGTQPPKPHVNSQQRKSTNRAQPPKPSTKSHEQSQAPSCPKTEFVLFGNSTAFTPSLRRCA